MTLESLGPGVRLQKTFPPTSSLALTPSPSGVRVQKAQSLQDPASHTSEVVEAVLGPLGSCSPAVLWPGSAIQQNLHKAGPGNQSNLGNGKATKTHPYQSAQTERPVLKGNPKSI